MTAVDETRGSRAGEADRKPGLREQLRARSGSRQLPTRGRSYGQLAAGVVVLLVSALIGAYVFTQSGATTSVLAVGSPVAKGEVIERGDMVSKQVAGVDGSIAVQDIERVIGSTAAVDMTAGQVIVDDAITSDPIPGPGESVVGLSLTAAQMPADLAPGDLVQVVSVPAADEATAGVAEATVLAARAQVLSVTGGGEGNESRSVVTVVVPQGESNQLAASSAAGRAAVVQIPAGENAAAAEQPQADDGDEGDGDQ